MTSRAGAFGAGVLVAGLLASLAGCGGGAGGGATSFESLAAPFLPDNAALAVHVDVEGLKGSPIGTIVKKQAEKSPDDMPPEAREAFEKAKQLWVFMVPPASAESKPQMAMVAEFSGPEAAEALRKKGQTTETTVSGKKAWEMSDRSN